MFVAGTLLSFDIVLDVDEQAGSPGALFRLAGRTWPAGDPGGQSFLRIVRTQGFQPGEPLLVRHPGGDILSTLDFVPFPLQPGKQIFQVGGYGDQPVDGGFQLCLVAGAVLCGLMLNVALALIPARDDDGQAVFFAQPVAGPAYLVIAALVGMVMLVIGEADRIENQVIMDVILVNVSGEDKFIFAAQDLPCQFHADPVGFLWRDLPRFKGLDQVAAQVRTFVNGMAACPFKFNVGGLGGAAEGGHQQFPIRLVGVADIVNRRFQR